MMQANDDDRSVPTCPVCGWVASGPPVEDRGRGRLFRCSGCDLVFAEPDSYPAAGWYEDAAISRIRYTLASSRSAQQLLKMRHRRFLRDMPARGGRLLEIGCAEGAFLAIAGLHYAAEGIDTNRKAVEMARERFGLQFAHAMSVEEYVAVWRQAHHPPFDVITLFDVLEHVTDLASLMDSILVLLAPQGWLALTTPNRERFPNLREDSDDPPHHVTRWSGRAISVLLARHGFRVSRMETFTEPGSILVAAMDKALPSLRDGVARLGTGRPGQTAGGRARNRIVSALSRTRFRLASVLEWPFDITVGSWRNRGQSLYCLAQRDGPRPPPALEI